MDSQGGISQGVDEEVVLGGADQVDQASLGGEVVGNNMDGMVKGPGPAQGGTSS